MKKLTQRATIRRPHSKEKTVESLRVIFFIEMFFLRLLFITLQTRSKPFAPPLGALFVVDSYDEVF